MKFLPSMGAWLVCLHFTSSQASVYNSTALVLATNDQEVDHASYLLNGYGISFESFEIAQAGQGLPTLESLTGGKYGVLVIVSQLIINGKSLLTDTQWNTLYDYQVKYSVRMVHLNVSPGPDFGVKSIGSCCENGVEQNLTLVESAVKNEFPTAGLKTTAQLSTLRLFHYPASIIESNSLTTTAFAEFQTNQYYTEPSVAAVINKFDTGREQMAFFLAVGNWSITSVYLGHAWINWGYRGTYPGYRRIHLNTQVDDLFLATQIYNSTAEFRARDKDMEQLVEWTGDLNSRLSTGSSYFTEFGFNFDGNVLYTHQLSENSSQYMCDEPVFTSWTETYISAYAKPDGNRENVWPDKRLFDFKAECIFVDSLARFFANTSNRDLFGLVSHTFSHIDLTDATYHDAYAEMSFNLAYAELMNFTNAAKFSGSGLIPPAITGLYNGDVIKAWSDNGLWNAIGDNTISVLRNSDNHHWPLMTTEATNGYAGYQVTPRFATRIYYDCDHVDTNMLRWTTHGGGAPDMTIHDLLEEEKLSVANQLLSLFHDPYMFHQPNIRSSDVNETMINGSLQKLSLLEMWVEVVTAEISRLVTWPIITLKHDHIAKGFNHRMLRDACKPVIQYTTTNGAVTSFAVLSNSNSCEVPIPVTVAQNLSDTKGFVTEQLGSDPATIWVKLDGKAESFTFA